MRYSAWACAAALLVAACDAQPVTTDAAIRQAMIRNSIASYSGSCPCPYSKTRDGQTCGERSAYSQPGGAAPLCYQSDVTDDMVTDYRARNGG